MDGMLVLSVFFHCWLRVREGRLQKYGCSSPGIFQCWGRWHLRFPVFRLIFPFVLHSWSTVTRGTSLQVGECPFVTNVLIFSTYKCCFRQYFLRDHWINPANLEDARKTIVINAALCRSLTEAASHVVCTLWLQTGHSSTAAMTRWSLVRITRIIHSLKFTCSASDFSHRQTTGINLSTSVSLQRRLQYSNAMSDWFP